MQRKGRFSFLFYINSGDLSKVIIVCDEVVSLHKFALQGRPQDLSQGGGGEILGIKLFQEFGPYL